jgi:hypothetical protein
MMDSGDLKLDGNAVAGLLHTIFAYEMTTASAICNRCGSSDPVGTLMVYNQAPGTVIRCPTCDNVLIRVVHGRGRYWLDLRGMRSLEIAVEA